jgi:hypothetical protein
LAVYFRSKYKEKNDGGKEEKSCKGRTSNSAFMKAAIIYL